MLFFSKRGMKDSNKHKSFVAFSFIMKKMLRETNTLSLKYLGVFLCILQHNCFL